MTTETKKTPMRESPMWWDARREWMEDLRWAGVTRDEGLCIAAVADWMAINNGFISKVDDLISNRMLDCIRKLNSKETRLQTENHMDKKKAKKDPTGEKTSADTYGTDDPIEFPEVIFEEDCHEVIGPSSSSVATSRH